MFALISTYLNKILIVVIVALVAVAGYFWVMNKAAQAEKKIAEQNYQQVQSANETLQLSLKEEQAAKIKLEKALSSRIASQKRIEEQSKQALDAKERELNQLRKKYETVDAFLNMPVPADFVDQWMRKSSR